MTRTADGRTHTNRLIHETSPYLLQHAHNPVDWHPWDDEALERAREENKLILLSIGYAACHWCHVMERESFEDESIATLMNENFVSIKVDREERPDLDEIYMAATQLLNRGQGGWPMTVFLTPDLEPVFAGTYFPPQDMYGRPGFVSVLEQVARAWREDPQGLRIRAREFTEHLRRSRSVGPALAVGEDALRKALDDYRDDFDPQYGGFGGAPKFPPSVGLTLLLRLHRRFDESHALDMAIKTLEGMARGGMYDHIGGGFARYSTDRRWLVPHFEKMLYDNALLARAYLEGYQATGDEFLGRIAVETLDYVLRDMTDPGGGFYSSTDADSEGEEGRFFVWTPQQVSEVLEAEEARRLCGYYDITAGGNWEGKSIPNTPRSVEDVASDLGISPNELTRTLEAARPKLYEARERRPKPGLDDKILTAWNGLMIGALAEGYRVLGHRRYLEAAGSAARFILDHLSRDDGGLLRSYRDGRARFNGYLEDYAYLGEGLLDLYEASGDTRWLRESERLLERALKDFGDEPNGAFYSTARDHENLLMRFADGTDGATPAASAAAAHVLARLSYHLDRADLRHRAGRAIRAFGSLISRYPRGFAKSLIVVDFLLEGPVELAFVGGRDSPELEALERAVASHYLPNRIQAIHDPEADAAADLPLLRGKGLVDGKPALYVCRNFACRAPVTEPTAVASELAVERDAASPHGSITEPVAGRATAEGTGRYASRFSPHGYNLLGATGLVASRIGFGGYRVHERSPEHRAALSQALRSGVNLIDTSSNYMDGGSERLIAGVLRDLIDDGEISREEIVVVSKLGYLQGPSYEEARRREEEGKPFPDVVKHEDGLWHCIHPDFLRFELRRSLDRLELETLDLCLLHNPEYFLADAARHGTGIDEAREELYRRIALAFEYLESEVSEGRLAGYGVSSNTLPSPTSAPDAVSVDELAAAARRAAGDDHHLRAIQLPLNLIECGAVLERNSGPDSSRSVLESAEDHGIAVLVNRPLNATLDGTLHRLADVPAPANHIDLGSALDRLTDLELAFAAEIAPKLPEEGLAADPGRIFRLAEQLQQLRTHTKSLAHWSQVEAQVRYAIGATVGLLNASLRGELAARWSDWREGYLEEMEDVLRAFRDEAAERSREFAASLNALLGPSVPTERRSESLARKALYLVASTPGVGCTLNGMRTPDYVRDAIEVLDWPPVESTENIYRAVTEAL